MHNHATIHFGYNYNKQTKFNIIIYSRECSYSMLLINLYFILSFKTGYNKNNSIEYQMYSNHIWCSMSEYFVQGSDRSSIYMFRSVTLNLFSFKSLTSTILFTYKFINIKLSCIIFFNLLIQRKVRYLCWINNHFKFFPIFFTPLISQCQLPLSFSLGV